MRLSIFFRSLPWVILAVGLAASLLIDMRTPEQRLRAQTIDLPAVTTAELFVLDDSQEMPPGQGFPLRPYGHEVAVLAQRTISGREAEQLAEIWRTRNFSGSGAMCHYPVYGLRFYSGWRLVLETSICWECINCQLEEKAGTFDWQGFADMDSRRGTRPKEEMDFALLEKLRVILPPPPKVGAKIALFLGQWKRVEKNLAKTRRELDAAVQLDPQNYDVRYERAKLFEEQGHLAEALHEITLGLPHAVKWKREYGYSKRAKLHLQMGQVDEALQDVTSAFNEHDEGISAGDLHRLRAEIYEKLGRKVDAEKDRQAAAKLP